MKSVGEVMAIGRTFPEVLQKALRMLDIGVGGLDPDAFQFEDLRDQLRNATPLRVFAIARALAGWHATSKRSMRSPESTAGFCTSIASIVRVHDILTTIAWPLPRRDDAYCEVARLLRRRRSSVLPGRRRAPPGSSESRPASSGIWPRSTPWPREFPADTNYLYTTLQRDAERRRRRRGARRSWCWGPAPIASVPASSSIGAASTRSRRASALGLRDASCSITTRKRSAPITTSATDWCSMRSASRRVLDLYELRTAPRA